MLSGRSIKAVGCILVFVCSTAIGQVAQEPRSRAFQEESRRLLSPPELSSEGNLGAPTLPCPMDREIRSRNGIDVTANLKISRSQHVIFNPATGQNDLVELRTYDDCLTGPTIRLKPGDRFHLNVKNDLSENDPSCPATLTNHNDPNCFNSDNIHTHGLHVSPDGNADNVQLTIPPQSTFSYVYDLPATHPAGTFWYHSHRHGSTALSVSSGMEGVIVIEGNRRVQDKKAPDDIADVDTILHTAAPAKKFKEQILLFQQISYACFDPASGPAYPKGIPQQNATGWFCNQGQIGLVENYPEQFGFVNGKDSWSASQRFTEINGKVQPTYIVPNAGTIERWRLIHGGVRDTINLQITKTNGAALRAQVSNAGTFFDTSHKVKAEFPENKSLDIPTGRDKLRSFISAVCDTTHTIPQFEFAADGLTRNHILQKTSDMNVLQPGYRSDVLVAFPEPGFYCVLDQPSAGPTTIIAEGNRLGAKEPQLLAIVEVGGTKTVDINRAWLLRRLVEANTNLPPAVKSRLSVGDISSYAPHRDLSTEPIAQTAFADFSFVLFNVNGVTTIPPTPTPQQAVLLGQAAIAPTLAGAQALVADTNAATLPNAATYNPGIVNWTGKLDTVDQWTVLSANAPHVFHIHVNPFQVMDIKNGGQSIFDASGHCTELDLKDAKGNPAPDPQYCDLFDQPNKPGLFRDTIFIKPGYQIVFRTKYEKPWIGEFVMHCHILDHEDQGMMQNVVITNGAPFMSMENMTAMKMH